MNVNAIILKEWAICSICGCKLFKLKDNSSAKNIEIKCHGCKNINEVIIKEKENVKN